MITMDVGFDGSYINNELQCGWNCGLGSNLTVTLWTLIDLHNLGHTPDNINFSNSFQHYKNEDQTLDVYPIYFSHNPLVSIDNKKIDKFNHHGIYKEIDYNLYSQFIRKYFIPSIEMENLIHTLRVKYQIDRENTLVLYYRGTDKVLEVPQVPISTYIEKAKEILKDKPNMRILVQTDEIDFLNECYKELGNRCFHIEELYVGTTAVHLNTGLNIDRLENGKLFLAVTYTISECNTIVFGTGNVSLWIAFFRGNANNTFQMI